MTPVGHSLLCEYVITNEEGMMDEAQMDLYRLKADLLKAAGHPIRLAVIDFLRDGEECVCRIAEHVGAERSNVSRHLAVMTKAGLVAGRKDGTMVYYRVRIPCVIDCLDCIEQCLRERVEAEAALLNGG